MKKDKLYWLSILFLLTALLPEFSKLQAQGWTYGSQLINDDGGPYLADGNYVTAIADFDDGLTFSLTNFPSPAARYYFTAFQGGFAQATFQYYSLDPSLHYFSRAAVRVSHDTLAVLEEVLPVAGGYRKIYLALYEIKIPPGNGATVQRSRIWHKEVYGLPNADVFARSLRRNANGEYYVLGEKTEQPASNFTDVIAIKLSHDGDVIWTRDLGVPGEEQAVALVLSNSPAGGLQVLQNSLSTVNPAHKQMLFTIIDANGITATVTVLSAPSVSEEGYAMIGLADGNLLISALDLTGSREMFFRKIDNNGNTIWQQNYPMTDRGAISHAMLEDTDGSLVATGQVTDSLTTKTSCLLLKLDAGGTPVWEREIGKSMSWKSFKNIVLFPGGGYLMGGTVRSPGYNTAYWARTDVNGIVKAGLITGNVFHDLDVDCANSGDDIPLKNWMVEARIDSATVFYGNTDSLGNYRIECDTGDYVVRLILPNAYWDACANDIALTVGYLDTVALDFAVQSIIECPYLTVDHGTSIVRTCDTTYFYIDYCNLGTVMANSAYLEMTLDPLFTFLDSDIPPSSINGNVITFPLGNIESGVCGSFSFSALVSCDAELGYVACSEAHIFPDSLCLPPAANWSGAFIKAEGNCVGDSVQFNLHNVGLQPMAQAMDYIVIEDAVLLMQGTFNLGAGEDVSFPFFANGATFHLLAGQEPGAPGNALPIAAVEGCVGSSGNTPSAGYFNQFSQNDGDNFLSIFCPPVVSSYDPNDKQAVPTGFDDEHYIFPNTELEYTIRFQNTGTDTAFRVILLDTLSAYLNPATVRPGASSHPYTFEIEENGVLRFTFPNIQLPQQAVNEAASQGFVNFRIAQQARNPIGTVIENSAGIYFDFNLPVITNTTWHTIHEPLIQVISAVDENTPAFGQILVYPNPAVDVVHFKMPEQAPESGVFSLYNSVGKQVKTGLFVDGLYRFERETLPPGVYFYQVENKGLRLYSGKVLLR